MNGATGFWTEPGSVGLGRAGRTSKQQLLDQKRQLPPATPGYHWSYSGGYWHEVKNRQMNFLNPRAAVRAENRMKKLTKWVRGHIKLQQSRACFKRRKTCRR